MSLGERSVELQGGQVSANYFDVLGIAPHIGSFFSNDLEDAEQADDFVATDLRSRRARVKW